MGDSWRHLEEEGERERDGARQCSSQRKNALMKCEFHSKRAFVAMAGCGLYKWACDKRQRLPYAATLRGRFGGIPQPPFKPPFFFRQFKQTLGSVGGGPPQPPLFFFFSQQELPVMIDVIHHTATHVTSQKMPLRPNNGKF